MANEKTKDPGTGNPLVFFFFIVPFFFSLPISEDHRLPSFPTSPPFLRRFTTENSLGIKAQFPLLAFYALLRHKRTAVKQTIVNTIEERAPSASLHAFLARYAASTRTISPARLITVIKFTCKICNRRAINTRLRLTIRRIIQFNKSHSLIKRHPRLKKINININ